MEYTYINSIAGTPGNWRVVKLDLISDFFMPTDLMLPYVRRPKKIPIFTSGFLNDESGPAKPLLVTVLVL
jgi:hypothetical protein